MVGRAHITPSGPLARDPDLWRHGQRIASRGGKNAKKRALRLMTRRTASIAVSLPGTWATTGEADRRSEGCLPYPSRWPARCPGPLSAWSHRTSLRSARASLGPLPKRTA
jgi:hypothetical protein